MKSIYDVIQASAQKWPNKTFISSYQFLDDAQSSLSFGELARQVNQFVNCLHDVGLQSNESVAILLPNIPSNHVAIWGAQSASSSTLINSLLSAERIADIVQAANATVLVGHGDLLPKLESVRGLCSQLRAGFIVEPKGALEWWRDFSTELSRYPGDAVAIPVHHNPERVAAMFHTGGTTGSPKIVPLTHANLLANAQMIADVLTAGPSDVFLCGLPLFHVNGVMVTGLAPILAGSRVVLPLGGYRNPETIARFWETVARERVSYFSAVPTILSALLGTERGDWDISSLRYALLGAAPLSVEVFRKFEEATGLKILEGYGLTESTCSMTLNRPDGERKVGSIGKPYGGGEARVARPIEGRLEDCSPGEVGHLFIRGKHVFNGYLQPTNNVGLWFEGWFDTGDLAARDEDGYLWHKGRSKDIIIRGGHNLDPAEIEEHAYRHSAVRLAAAIGRWDIRLGEVPVLFVELGESCSEEALADFMRSSGLEPAAVPKSVEILESLPKTEVGKIYKPALRDAANRKFICELFDIPTGKDGVQVEVKGKRVSIKGYDLPADSHAVLKQLDVELSVS